MTAIDDRLNDPDRLLEDQLADRFNAAWRSSVLGIIEAGRVLREARDKLRGRFVEWVESRLHRTRRTADRLIAIADDPRIETHGSQMPASWRTLYEITRLSDEDFYRLLEAGTIRPDMKRRVRGPGDGRKDRGLWCRHQLDADQDRRHRRGRRGEPGEVRPFEGADGTGLR